MVAGNIVVLLTILNCELRNFLHGLIRSGTSIANRKLLQCRRQYFRKAAHESIFTGYRAVQAVVTEAGYGSLGISGHDLASQFDRKMSIHGRIKGNACVSFLLENRKR